MTKAKAKYEAAMKELKQLNDQKDEIRRKEIYAAVENSSRFYDEIMSFLRGEELSSARETM